MKDVSRSSRYGRSSVVQTPFTGGKLSGQPIGKGVKRRQGHDWLTHRNFASAQTIQKDSARACYSRSTEYTYNASLWHGSQYSLSQVFVRLSHALPSPRDKTANSPRMKTRECQELDVWAQSGSSSPSPLAIARCHTVARLGFTTILMLVPVMEECSLLPLLFSNHSLGH